MNNYSASPAVRARAREQGINLDTLAASLGKAQLSMDDLTSGSVSVDSQRTQDLHYWDIDHRQFGTVTEQTTSKIDRVAAANLSAASSVIPQVTHQDHVDVSAVEAIRSQYKAHALSSGVRLTSLAFYVKALALNLKRFPKFNSSLSADGETLFIKNYVHIGVAVDTEHGLMVPVIRDADKKGLWQIAKEISDLAGRAKSRKLGPTDMGGASMTISNLGGIGGSGFTPIVNPPEVAILGITRTEMRPQWNGETFVAKPMAPLDMSYDHRVINGADAARFMTSLTASLADPRLLLI